MTQLKGILPALVTPFDKAGNVNYDMLGNIIEFQLKAGVTGFVPLGSTGEYYALTNEERRQVLATVREVVGDRGVLIAGANGSCTREVIEQVKQTRDAGYTNLLIAPPYYALPSQDELIGHYQAILDAAPDINVVLYNYPVRTNVEVGFGVLDAFKDNKRVIAHQGKQRQPAACHRNRQHLQGQLSTVVRFRRPGAGLLPVGRDQLDLRPGQLPDAAGLRFLHQIHQRRPDRCPGHRPLAVPGTGGHGIRQVHPEGQVRL